MDPISIITLAGSATTATYQVSKAVYQFINAVRDVDDTVHALASEMASLRRSLDAINIVLANPLVKSDKACAPENAPIWSATAGALEDCRKSLAAIEKKIAPHQHEKARHTLFKRAMTTFKLNLSKDEIANLRSQVQTHTHSLQLSLQMINLLVSGLGPVSAVEEIGQDISKLSSALEELDLSKVDGDSSASLARIKATAQDVLNKAPELVSSGLLETADEQTRAKSIQALREIVSEYNKSIYEVAAVASSTQINNETDDGDSDSDEEVESLLTSELFAKASDKFAAKAYREAEAYYRDGLRHHGNLARIKQSVDAASARARLAICCFQEDKLEEAELMFLIMSRSDEQITPMTLEACHYLAQTYLCMFNFEVALEHISMAVKGRRKVFGKSSPQYFSSLKLQALIHEANGDFITSDAYTRKIIPETEDLGENSLARARFSGYSSSEHLRLSLTEKKDALVELTSAEIIEHPSASIRVMVKGKEQRLTDFKPEENSSAAAKALVWAASNGKTLLAKWLLARSTPVDTEVGIDHVSALKLAAHVGHHEIVRLLLQSGANPEKTDHRGSRPLFWAALWGHKAAVQVLLEHGADVNAIDPGEDSALHGAACKGHVEVVRLLLDAGADVTLRTTRTEKNALLEAIANGHWQAAELLLARGSPVNIRDWNGETPLGEALSRGSASFLKKLLDAGADVTVSYRRGEQALHRAMRRGNAEAVNLLVKAGAEVDGGDCEGPTPLFRAVDCPDADCARVLLEAGAQKNKTPKDYLLPGSVVKHNGDKAMIQILKDYVGFQDCRARGQECRQCARWDEQLA